MRLNNWKSELHNEMVSFGTFKYNGFVRRDAVISACTQRLAESDLIALKGEEGRGKTTLLFALEKELGNEYNVIPFITAITPRAETESDMLEYFVYCLENLTQCFDYAGIPTARAFSILAAKLYELSGKKTLLLIDDPLRLILTSDSYIIPEYVKIIITSEIDIKQAAVVDVPELERDEAKQVLYSMLNKHGISVGDKVFEAVLSKKCSRNAAYLQLVAQRLSAACSYENADDSQMVNTVTGIPDNLRWGCYILTTEAGAKTSYTIQKEALALISASRYGLKKSDIKALFLQGGLEWDENKFSVMEQYLKSYFYYRKDEAISFSSPFIQDYLHTCFGGGTHEIESQLLQYLKSLEFDNSMRCSEIIFHARIADDRKFALQYIASVYDCADETIKETTKNEIIKNTFVDEGEWMLDVINTPADTDEYKSFSKLVFEALSSIESNSKAIIFNRIYKALINKLI